MSATRNDLPTQLLTLLRDRMPPTLQPWSQAMLSELAVIEGFWTRLRWSLGGMITLVTARLRLSAGRSPREGGRLDVSLIAGYQFVSSAVLIGVMTWQLPRITESWKYAVPVLIMSYAVCALPAVLGLGLALRDDAARIGTIIFSIAHALLNFEYIRRGLAPHAGFTAVRIAADVLIIIALNRRAVRRAFQLSPIALHLRGDSFPPHGL
jgi:hypothetical protein